MPLLDLVTPWATAIASGEEGAARFRGRHAAVLDRIRRHVAPDQPMLPLIGAGPPLDHAGKRAHDPSTLDALEQVERSAASLGADIAHVTALLAMASVSEPMIALPGDPPLLVLSLSGRPELASLQLAKVRGQALLTRWSLGEHTARIQSGSTGSTWDQWELTRTVPLREWLYASGVATHVAAAVLPELLPHQLLGLKRGAWARLRERERALRDELAIEMDHSGLGPLLRWLTPDTPAGLRTTATQVIPPGAGAYLAWRMTAERVARVGLRDALRLAA